MSDNVIRKRNKYIDADGNRLKMGARYSWLFGDFVDVGVIKWSARNGHVFAPDRCAGTEQVFRIPFCLVSVKDPNQHILQCGLFRLNCDDVQPKGANE